MHEYHRIKKEIVSILTPLGYKECKPDTDLDFCGSIHCIYELEDKRIMIQWDGEEGFGMVSRWQGEPEGWQDMKSIVPESIEAEFSNALKLLIVELKELL